MRAVLLLAVLALGGWRCDCPRPGDVPPVSACALPPCNTDPTIWADECVAPGTCYRYACGGEWHHEVCR